MSDTDSMIYLIVIIPMFIISVYVASRGLPLLVDHIQNTKKDKKFYSNFPLKDPNISQKQRGILYESMVHLIPSYKNLTDILNKSKTTDYTNALNIIVFKFVLVSHAYRYTTYASPSWWKKLRWKILPEEMKQEILTTARSCIEEMITNVCGEHDTQKLCAKWSESGKFSVWFQTSGDFAEIAVKDSKGRHLALIRKGEKPEYTDVFAYWDLVRRLTV